MRATCKRDTVETSPTAPTERLAMFLSTAAQIEAYLLGLLEVFSSAAAELAKAEAAFELYTSTDYITPTFEQIIAEDYVVDPEWARLDAAVYRATVAHDEARTAYRVAYAKASRLEPLHAA
ncbi:hypothetical protein SEA_BARNSTORMER_74 [Microbacterium phage Barnstormer]|uniref:Uncharacterized protein n=1 Tax=Microbacterium phage Barnstormer TaxID=3028491 RepID=A0AAF0CLA3_9CAUD|nr:hypothetical protein SEA_BARNSTORMER_74 [Microbacterium phage Barnstormer]WDS52180.1 hypothetical protein SEA_UTZCHIPS_74 [Microbacterium phage UtzChips]